MKAVKTSQCCEQRQVIVFAEVLLLPWAIPGTPNKGFTKFVVDWGDCKQIIFRRTTSFQWWQVSEWVSVFVCEWVSECVCEWVWVSDWVEFNVPLWPALRSFSRRRFAEPGIPWTVTDPSTNRGGRGLTSVNEHWRYRRPPQRTSQWWQTPCTSRGVPVCVTKLASAVPQQLWFLKRSHLWCRIHQNDGRFFGVSAAGKQTKAKAPNACRQTWQPMRDKSPSTKQTVFKLELLADRCLLQQQRFRTTLSRSEIWKAHKRNFTLSSRTAPPQPANLQIYCVQAVQSSTSQAAEKI